MIDALPRRAAAFLRRASLLAGLLAIIAGIFGMHVMTGPHSMPASTAVQGVEMQHVMQPPATTHSSHAPSATPVIDSSPLPDTRSMPGPSCADLGGCAMMASMDASCIPSPGNTSLAAPLPGQTPFAAHNDADAPTPASAYSYLPGSPSPGQLCISRT
ncbi:hypothetical protein [Pseudarthrobacter sp. NIBRBAC000502770]|uniref:hypothetical protein n=1 Tax=Pseudarthrobacter sp. NIBRBAC000502770 TaxID=2590785 RepID=UPI00113FD016|nr:hypothetical protein [Pseudarthrobacter sp. NIBRBAC000502770]QDG87090.1 hypothetical protein NIBR502770_00250 [Pseudarthrobacter sp. NIBRBAC000502770]